MIYLCKPACIPLGTWVIDQQAQRSTHAHARWSTSENHFSFTTYSFPDLDSSFELWIMEVRAKGSLSLLLSVWIPLCCPNSQSRPGRALGNGLSRRQSTLSLVRPFRCGIALTVRKSVLLPNRNLLVMSSIGPNSSSEATQMCIFSGYVWRQLQSLSFVSFQSSTLLERSSQLWTSDQLWQPSSLLLKLSTTFSFFEFYFSLLI